MRHHHLTAYLSSSSQSLLKGLLTREASKRLGYGAKGSAEIKAHPFFKGINWAALEQRRVPSPFKPTLKGIDSVENFDKVRFIIVWGGGRGDYALRLWLMMLLHHTDMDRHYAGGLAVCIACSCSKR